MKKLPAITLATLAVTLTACSPSHEKTHANAQAAQISPCQYEALFFYNKKLSAHQQLDKFAKLIKMPEHTLSMVETHGYKLVTLHYKADGKLQYYIAAPTGCVVNTAVDPRKVSSSLMKKYPHANWLISSRNIHVNNKDNKTLFNVDYRITKGCVACQVQGNATVQFTFNSQHLLEGTKLVRWQTSAAAKQEQRHNRSKQAESKLKDMSDLPSPK